MRIIAASKKCGLFWSRFDFTTNNADIIRIIEFVNGVLISKPKVTAEYCIITVCDITSYMYTLCTDRKLKVIKLDYAVGRLAFCP